MAPTKRKATAPALGAMGAPKQKLKQGSLFSFFSKKPEQQKAPPASTNDHGAASASSTAAAVTNNNAAAQQQQQQKRPAARPLDPEIAKVKVGSFIEIYWEDDEAYYKAFVEKQRSDTSFYIKYSLDGQTEWVDLTTERFRRIVDTTTGGDKQQKRRRQVLQDDDDEDDGEEEFEFDDAESEGSVYKQDDDDEDDDEDADQWMSSEDEDDSNNNKKKKPIKKVRKLVVTGHEPTLSQSTAAAAASRPLSALAAKKTPHKSATALAQRIMTPRQITPSLSVAGGQLSQQQSQSQRPMSSPPFTPAASAAGNTQQASPQQAPPPPMYEKGIVNPAGSHVHNHLKFLQAPRDAQGHPTTHPDYDARTLTVNVKEWESRSGGKMTDAVQQWWDLKAQYFDTVLLFKTGKFYELFHMDADVGVDVCSLSYMKGHMAHAGFPEISYGPMADKLVRAGYKVARVEQTETPQMLQERKKSCKGRGKTAPKVVNREVCSIMTLGTRTFCYLDDRTGILAEAANDAMSVIGPLLVIREVLLDTTATSSDDKMDVEEDDDDEQVQPVAEYGITVVDAVRGDISIGQFADDCLRTRMGTLLTTFNPSEIILQGGENGASPTLKSLIQSAQQTSPHPCRLEVIRQVETFPNSTAIDDDIRRKMQRKTSQIKPWDVPETLEEIHRRKYYSAASKKQQPQDGESSVSRWPNVLRAAVEGNAELALSSFGAALFYLQRNLIDAEILSMQKVKAYIPPTSSTVPDESVDEIRRLAEEQNRQESAIAEEAEEGGTANVGAALYRDLADSTRSVAFNEGDINHLALDGTTVRSLELLCNTADNKSSGSLWSKIDHTVTPSGRRLLRAWLLRPLFRKADIDRRADAVEELSSGANAVAAGEARKILSKVGDIERLLSRVHSMSGTSEAAQNDDEDGGPRIHPNDRAILYEKSTYTKRMVGDFSKVLKGLEHASQVPEKFRDIDIQSELLRKIVRPIEQGGCFPEMASEIEWFNKKFNFTKAEKGEFEPSSGVDQRYDAACGAIAQIERELDAYKNEMCSNFLRPSSQARSTWKYANILPDSKDKYMIELPASVSVPNDFVCKGKRGSGNKQVNKYRTPVVERLVQDLEIQLDIKSEQKAHAMEKFFAKFDAKRDLWGAASQAVSLLDALCSLSMVSSKPGYCRPTILDCPPEVEPSINVVQGRHPCVEGSKPDSSDFVPNNLSLGTESSAERVLLLSGPNMGGKSTLLRQTCLIAILAQIGCYVPAEQCEITPIDRIYTRLGATDRILMGQSTFFVELAETAAALRGATRRSLVIMDELGRGTSTFDGTALASAAVKHLVERSKCLSLFATHYHSLLTEWNEHRMVRLGHMECLVGNGGETGTSSGGGGEDEADHDITFLYSLGEGTCPKSFGINVARLAGLPEGVLQKAKRVSSDFEQEMNSEGASSSKITARTAPAMKKQLYEAIHGNDWAKVQEIWQSLQ